jgi:hypothetical protein
MPALPSRSGRGSDTHVLQSHVRFGQILRRLTITYAPFGQSPIAIAAKGIPKICVD